ncbi:hypothetical protein KIL84_022644 [Mauremys mutica]|uniref:Uncharacterized protein n=1 Tax=Mauremys mutica TaxID=74926 RepID=A0A9D3WR17_9SAUR|nr:hypothetical protein KIL84_022644 [Mauremys mutica]
MRVCWNGYTDIVTLINLFSVAKPVSFDALSQRQQQRMKGTALAASQSLRLAGTRLVYFLLDQLFMECSEWGRAAGCFQVPRHCLPSPRSLLVNRSNEMWC